MAKEKNLTTVTSVAAADFARLVTSAGASVKATAANLAKYIIETYNGSTVAGSAQSVKAALDSLNSKTCFSAVTSEFTATSYISSINVYASSNMVWFYARVKAGTPDNTAVVTFPTTYKPMGNRCPLSVFCMNSEDLSKDIHAMAVDNKISFRCSTSPTGSSGIAVGGCWLLN